MRSFLAVRKWPMQDLEQAGEEKLAVQ